MRSTVPLLSLLLLSAAVQAADVPPDITVAADGSGQFTSIQKALDSIPKDNKDRILIYVKDGTYNERIRVDPSFITLRGQSREKTKIEFVFPYSAYRRGQDPLGRAIVNLGPPSAPSTQPDKRPDGPTGSDFVLQNITVHNNSGVHNHSFTLYTETADRLVITDANILSPGGDTLAPMNTNQGPAGGGRYYFARLDVRGAVDFVCPKGWCYMVDSHLFEEIKDASTWHNGFGDKNQKFVLKNVHFEGVDGFYLGRHHVAANFYYINCTVGKNIGDRPVWLVRYAAGSAQNQINDRQNPWGDRVYFYNMKKEGGGEFPWMKNNLDTAEGSPKPDQITAAWTFDNTWNPERTDAPTIKSIRWDAPGHKIAVTFSENVSVKGQPRVLSDGEAAAYSSGSGSDTLLFDASANSAGKVRSLDLNGGFIIATEADATLRQADLTLPK
jgi:pectinesterase